MLHTQLRRIPEFADVCPAELRGFAQRAHVLCLPPRRWLVQNSRDLRAHFYLLRGTLSTIGPSRRLRYPAFGALSHFYPGCAGVRTETACQILRIDNAQREFLLQRVPAAESALAGPEDGWLHRFLSSQMMVNLPPRTWQQLLAAFERRPVSAGQRLLRRGEPGEQCYVVERGHAVVHRGRHTLCHLAPGDFFGEDALLLGGRRNADVTALEPMVVHALDRHTFSSVLVKTLVQPVARCARGVRLNVGEEPLHGALPVDLTTLRDQAGRFDPRVDYYVVGGEPSGRMLCAFLLLQRGVRAHPVVD